MRISLNSINSLDQLRGLSNLEFIHLDVFGKDIVENGIGMLIKYAIWSVKKSGSVFIKFHPLNSCKSEKWSMLIRAISQWMNEDGVFSEIDRENYSVKISRKSDVLADTWGVGLVVSGKMDELPLVEKFLDSIKNQSCNVIVDIAICGPSESMDMYNKFDVRYVVYDSPADSFGRFLINKKKNFLISNLSGEKILIAHARIALSYDCLNGLPREFDIISPKIFISGTDIPYLDWNVVALKNHGTFFSFKGFPLCYPRNEWRTCFHFGIPFVDGGLLIFSRKLLNTTRLNNNIAWGEAEDVDFCQSAISNNMLVELADTAIAFSQTCKTSRYKFLYKYVLYRIFSHIKFSILRLRLKFLG